ncbi:MAG: hypothetical protein R2932_19410 [Caldilineaceae bacterium]
MYDMEQSKTDGLNSYYRRLQQVDFYLEANYFITIRQIFSL